MKPARIFTKTTVALIVAVIVVSLSACSSKGGGKHADGHVGVATRGCREGRSRSPRRPRAGRSPG